MPNEQNESNESLNERLRQLDSELQQLAAADEGRRAEVEKLRAEIQPLLENPELDHSHRFRSLRERLDHAALHLQVEHPVLSVAIQRVLDELAAVGI